VVGLDLLTVLRGRGTAPRRLVGESIHVADEALSGIAAEFDMPRFSECQPPWFRLADPAARRLMCENAFPQITGLSSGPVLPVIG